MKNYTKIAVTAAILSMVCVQGGASIAKQLFPAIGPIATSALRIRLSAILLYFINRPNLRGLNRQQWLYCGAYGLGIAAMNLIFYMAIQRIPLGLGVTIEFIGPCSSLSRFHENYWMWSGHYWPVWVSC
ncbi:EamA family transporter [Sphingobacterium lactis]|uniref:EamA family transporter n=1 Tax=Sphingobacterium lactis TaxID=797291 RepID=UPI003EC83609